ncbi:acyltransferase family protein [Corynebacterium sp. H113]|uniref:acyltransferase family protein n=1 Tax=Corynebacterium sp. H113 TaxID=3133419 RepID=UPI0030AAB742
MPRPIDSHTKYVPALDGLRAIAVVAVVLYHLNVSWTPGGLLGVAMFFTLSGYLITSNLMRAKYQKDSWGLHRFWLRRFRRLLPAVVLTVLTVLMLSALIQPASLADRWPESLSSLLYINNWFVIATGNSYFDQFAGAGPLDHMWSLSIEEQFYLIWPLVLLLIYVVARGHRRVIIASTVALALGSFALMWFLASTGTDSTRIYEGTDTRAGGLLIGAALAIALVKRNGNVSVSLPIAQASGGIGVLGTIALIGALPDDSPFLYRGGLLLLSMLAAMAIVGTLHPESWTSKVLGTTPFRWIGERSYGIYLWHMPVVVFLPEQLGSTWVHHATVMGVSIVLAALSWTLIEDPIRKNGFFQPALHWFRRVRAVKFEGLPHPGIPRPVLSGAMVVLVAVATIGIPATVLGYGKQVNLASGSQQTMEIDSRPDVGEVVATGPARTRCTTVVHVGDSTSIGMFEDLQLPDPSDNAAIRYREVGANDVVTSVFGARATAEGWQDYPSAVASVQQLMAEGQPDGTCWVIATGVNDAANEAVGHAYPHDQRIQAMLDELEGESILWATATTGRDYGPWDIANMKLFNDALKKKQKKNANLHIFDWATDAKAEWFLDGDLVHYNATGNAERSARFADALAQAFPAKGKGPKNRIVTTKERDTETSADTVSTSTDAGDTTDTDTATASTTGTNSENSGVY